MRCGLFQLVATTLLAVFVSSAHAEGPAVSQVNGKLSTEGGVTGTNGESSGIGVVKGSLATPLGYPFGFQVDGMGGTAFGAPFVGGTAHLFWRDPAIGLFGPVATVTAGSGERLGWYGAEAELYAGLFTFGAWGGYHHAVDDDFGIAASSGFYGGSLTFYPHPDLALSIAAITEFDRVTGTGTVEFQPDLLARHNVAFYANGEVADHAGYAITAGVRFYFGADKTLIRRHREDDPMTAESWERAFTPSPVIPQSRASLAALIATNHLGQNTPTIQALESQYAEMWAQDAAAMHAYLP